MGKLLNYQQFLFETYGNIKVKGAKTRLLKTVSERILNEEENFYFKILLDNGYENKILEAIDNDNYDMLFESLQGDKALHENFLEKAKEKVESIKKKIKEVGKSALDKVSDGTKALLKVGGNILKPISAIIKKIGEGIKKAFEKAKELGQAAVDRASGAIREKIKKIVKDGDKKKSLTSEIGNLGAMASTARKLLSGDIEKDMKKAGEEAATADESVSYLKIIESSAIIAANNLIEEGYKISDILEELQTVEEKDIDSLLEGGDEGGLKIPFVSAIMNKIAHIQPFKFFHDIGHKAEDFANNQLEKLSVYTSKLGGAGPFKFAIIGALIGVAVSYYSESYAKAGVKAILHALEHAANIAIPGLGIIMKIIKYTGIALAVYGVIKSLVGQGEKDKEETDKEEKDKEEKDKEEKDKEEKDKEEK